jgi:hypothetical protein
MIHRFNRDVATHGKAFDPKKIQEEQKNNTIPGLDYAWRYGLKTIKSNL